MDADNRERKRAWKAHQRQLAQTAFPIPNELLRSMFDTIEAQIDENGCDHTLQFTNQWIIDHQQPMDRILGWLAEHGGFCDCEVIANVLDHWEQNR